ncbi:MAG TPA: hypothetical protein PKD59_14425 [Miltoncostaeaceae bacterium]|nr:hypothetical protein [Miltoncostaeaceae bacterium]
MIRRVAGAALVAASLALLAAAHGAAQSPPLPPCPPGTPVPPPPAFTATRAAVGSPERLVAGRPISIDYDAASGTAVERTTGPAGTVILDDIGSLVTLTLPAPGQIAMTASYYAFANETCAFPFTFTLDVQPADLVPAKVGVTREFGPRGGFRFGRLGTFGDFDQLKPSAGLTFACDGAKAPVPLSLVVGVERRLARRPSETSPTVRLDVPDPCVTRTTRVVGLGVRLWFVNNDPTHPDEGERFLAVEVTTKAATRLWARFAQDVRPLGSLRLYTAWKPQNGRFPAGWVVAPEAGFERARCRRPPATTGLGFRRWPLPPCPRR